MFKIFQKNKAIIQIDNKNAFVMVKDGQDNMIQQFTLSKPVAPIISQTTLDLFKAVIDQLLLLNQKNINIEVDFLDLKDLILEKAIDLNFKNKEIELAKKDLIEKTKIASNDALFDYKLKDNMLHLFIMSISFMQKVIDIFSRNNMKLTIFGKEDNK